LGVHVSQPLNIRWSQDIRVSVQYPKRKLYEAFHKYGIYNFQIHSLYTMMSEEQELLHYIEGKIIQYFETHDNIKNTFLTNIINNFIN